MCGVKPYVLRYWEQEFTQLKPMKRRGNRRYYQHHEVLLIRRIRELLYEQGFTISGARNQLTDAAIHREGAEPGSRHQRLPAGVDATTEIEIEAFGRRRGRAGLAGSARVHALGRSGAAGTAFDPGPARTVRPRALPGRDL